MSGWDESASAAKLADSINRLDTTIATGIARAAQSPAPPAAGIAGAVGAAGALAAGGAGGAALPVAAAMSAAAATATSATGAAATAAKAIDVRVVNDRSMVIPVTMIDPPKPEERTSILGSILGGAGSFLGGILGGLFSPISAIIAGAELIAVLAQAIVLVAKVDKLLDKLKGFGLFPISSLLDTLLGAVDKVIARLLPLVDWAVTLVEKAVNWVATVVSTATAWVGTVVNSLTTFLTKYLAFLLETVVKPAVDKIVGSLLADTIRPSIDLIVKDLFRSLVDTIGGILLAGVFAAANVLKAVFDWAWGNLAQVMTGVFNTFVGVITKLITAVNSVLPARFAIPVPTPLPPAPAPAALDLKSAATAGVADAKEAAKKLSVLLLGPAPEEPPKGTPTVPPKAGGAPAVAPKAGGAPGAAPVGAPTAPTFTMPELRLPGLELPRTPRSKEVAKILGVPESPAPAAPSGDAGTPAAAGAATGPLTLNGGITVHINADRIDAASADHTARQIAERVLAEINRLSDNDRFRRGLPTGALA